MSSKGLNIRPWAMLVAGGLFGRGVYLLWGWGGEFILLGLMLTGWVLAKERAEK